MNYDEEMDALEKALRDAAYRTGRKVEDMAYELKQRVKTYGVRLPKAKPSKYAKA